MKSFLTGFVIGLGGGLLLAPMAGTEVRKKLIEKVGKTTDKVTASAEPIVNAVREQVAQVAENEFGLDIERPQVSEIESTGVLELLNSASKTHLTKVQGIGEATARRIIEGRPYADVASVISGHTLSEEILEKLKKMAIEEAEKGAA